MIGEEKAGTHGPLQVPGARFVLESLLDTIPQLYEATDGPLVKSFHLRGTEAKKCSLRELGLPLLQYIDRCLKFLPSIEKEDTSLPSVMHYEWVQQMCAFHWLQNQSGISTWYKIIDYFLRTQKRTIENWAIAKSFIIDPTFPIQPNGELTKKVDFFDPKSQGLIDWLATSPFTFFRVTPNLDFIGYEAIAHAPVEDFSPDYIPDFLWPMASQVTRSDQSVRPLLVDSNQRGDLLISDRHSIIAARIKGRWTVYDHVTLETGIYTCLKQGERIRDSQSLKHLAHTLFRVLFDVSFKRHGGLIIVDEGLAKVKDYASGGVFVDEQSDFTKIIPSASFGEKAPDISAVRKLIELTSIDGAIILSSSGSMLGYGTMVRPHPGVVDGSGARTIAAKSAARHGAIAFSVSADGEILSYFQTKKYTGDRVHQMRL